MWNPRGGDAAAASVGAPAPAAAGGPPPPPPPPPPADIFAQPAKPSADDARNALLKDLNRGTDITSGLRKVTADQQTHKNPALRSAGVVAASDVKKSSTNGYAAGREAPAKPPKFELEGKKWMVEYLVGRKDIVIEQTEMNQAVSLYKCKDVLVQVKGKINSIVVDTCSKTAIVFDDIVACVEFINCQSVQAQVIDEATVNRRNQDVEIDALGIKPGD